MCTTDAARGFRVCGPLALAVSLSDVWERERVYDVPTGWRHASEADVRAHMQAAHAADPGDVYANREGWYWCMWEGVHREAFVCADTSEASGAWQHADENWSEFGDCNSSTWKIRSANHPKGWEFAGLVCVRE